MHASEESAAGPAGAAPSPRRSVAFLAVRGPLARTDVLGLCERVRVLLEGTGAGLLVCDVGSVGKADAGTVDALARLALTARRLGCSIRLDQACGGLQDLLDLLGLSDVLRAGAPSGVEPGRQAEQREQRRGVQEEADPGDPPV